MGREMQPLACGIGEAKQEADEFGIAAFYIVAVRGLAVCILTI